MFYCKKRFVGKKTASFTTHQYNSSSTTIKRFVIFVIITVSSVNFSSPQYTVQHKVLTGCRPAIEEVDFQSTPKLSFGDAEWSQVFRKTVPRDRGVNAETSCTEFLCCSRNDQGRVAIVVAPWIDPLFMERSLTQHFGPQERSNFFGSVWNVAPPEPVTWPSSKWRHSSVIAGICNNAKVCNL